MGNISTVDIFKKSFEYTLLGPLAIIVLGIALSCLDYFLSIELDDLLESIIVLVIGVFAGLYQMGYSSKILEETLKGSNRPPSVKYVGYFVLSGLKEAVLYVFYLIIISIIIVCGYLSNHDLIFIICIILSSFILYFITVASWNVTIHHGQIKYGFNIMSCFRLIKKIDHKQLVVTYILTLIAQSLIMHSFNLVHLSIFNIIYNFLINPFLLLFTERSLALVLKNTVTLAEK